MAGGASGSAVYGLSVDQPAGEFVLKVASRPGLRERARREVTFYRELAAQVPVLVPEFLVGGEVEGSAYLLLTAAGVPTDAKRWSELRWTELATELGRLHREQVLAVTIDRGATAREPASAEKLAAGERAWIELGCERLLAPLWASFEALGAAIRQLPACLCHGDFHLGNLLTDPADRFVWIDWQEVHIGHGPGDLALLWQRAGVDGVNPPREAMLTAYAAARGIPDDALLHRAAVASELTLVMLEWPTFFPYVPEPGRARIRNRLEHLVAVWYR
ncbi:aminoglycoside phosphotransferase (APT) family kinase protein [Kribbella sp. VKM Ac-2568]|nr:aminoglycoside phosphotransferase (APT) family kinase protein [Kribbella sp. VKM Ac-2568]